jgi:hypothetical protein
LEKDVEVDVDEGEAEGDEVDSPTVVRWPPGKMELPQTSASAHIFNRHMQKSFNPQPRIWVLRRMVTRAYQSTVVFLQKFNYQTIIKLNHNH